MVESLGWMHGVVIEKAGSVGIDRVDITKKVGRGGLGLLTGFRDFIARGNVVDLAVGIVIGAAFTGLVTQFTKDFIQPLISGFGGGTTIHAGQWKFRGQYFNWADFANQVVLFLLVAAVLYFLVVMPLNKLAERRNRNRKPDPVQISDEVAVLMEIRDALLAGARPAPAQRTPDRALVDDRVNDAPAAD